MCNLILLFLYGFLLQSKYIHITLAGISGVQMDVCPSVLAINFFLRLHLKASDRYTKNEEYTS